MFIGEIMNNKLNLYRRNGKIAYIRKPRFDELSFVKELWGNKENMGEIGEAYSFPKEKWEMFYKKMVLPTDGKNFYCLVYTTDDKPIGEVSFHGYNSATKVARINIKIHHEYRRNGYGEEALRLLLEYYFLEFGGEAIIDTVKTNEAKSLLRKVGFEEINNFRKQYTYKLTKKNFLNCKINNKKMIDILAYDDVDIMEYSIALNIFTKVNELLKDDCFRISSVSSKSNIKSKNADITVDRIISDDMLNPDIVIIPGGVGVDLATNDNILMNYIREKYNECDYVITFSNGIYFLDKFKDINGIAIPESKWKVEGTIEIERSFVDNGKLMFASNMVGIIELCIDVVKKFIGEDVSKELCKELGVF